MRGTLISIGLLLAATAAASAASGTRFWNLTHNTIDSLQLAPAGSSDYGPNLCLADKDKSVDHDERLQVTGIATGVYDARIHDVEGRSCSAKNVKVAEGKVFSIEEKELVDCDK